MNQPNSKEKLEIAFFEHNPYMSVELLDLLNDYKIICYNDDSTYRYLKKHWDIESYLNTNFLEEPESDQVAELMLGDKEFLSRAIQNRANSKILFFYMNRRMDELREKVGVPMFLPSFDIQERLGNKIFLSEICDKLALAKNESLSFEKVPEDSAELFEKCKETLGVPFIVQAEIARGECRECHPFSLWTTTEI